MQDSLDLACYPLDRPDAPTYEALVMRCRAELEREGMFNLENLYCRP